MHPKLAYVPPSAFRTLSTVSSSLNFVGLFHPTATSEIHFSGCFPDYQPLQLVVTTLPSWRYRRSPAAV
jgi:hypothetical protein